MAELAQVLELLRGQNEAKVKDREEDKMERERMAKQIKEDVKAEIKEVMKPWQDRTEAVEKKTESMEENITKLINEVAELRKHVDKAGTTWAGVAEAGVGAGVKVGAVLTGPNTAPLGRKAHLEQGLESNDDDKTKQELSRARRTLGFGPIRTEDIERQYKECCLFGQASNENDAKMFAVMELMLLDMKIPKVEQQHMDIVKVFAPRRDNAQMLYCEFRNISSVHRVYSHTRHMRRGTTITPYIPKEHYDRYRALEEICYRWRKEENFRTKVRMGESGLEVWRKRGEEQEYSKVPLDSLGELPPVTQYRREGGQVDRSITSSPPAGRPGYTPASARSKKGKRGRSKSETKSPESRSPLSKKTGVEGAGKKMEERILVGDATISPITNGLLKKPDLGKVSNIQLSTPFKKIQNDATNPDNSSSPIFRKYSTSA